MFNLLPEMYFQGNENSLFYTISQQQAFMPPITKYSKAIHWSLSCPKKEIELPIPCSDYE
jgi:hypothetical protein